VDCCAATLFGLHEIGQAFGKDHLSIQFMLSQHGGIVPAARRRSLLTLTLAERENISRCMGFQSIREIFMLATWFSSL
jgi:hypothetical protein